MTFYEIAILYKGVRSKTDSFQKIYTNKGDNMKSLKQYTLVGIIFVIIVGSIWHFVYEWSGNNFIVGFFFPVNESTWEHMKLLFFPMLIYSFYMRANLKETYPCITSALSFGILLGTVSIPILFYTYTGILGFHTTVLDIATFIVSVLIAFYVTYTFTLTSRLNFCYPFLTFGIIAFAVCFFMFTYFPPALGIFTQYSNSYP